jgi:hypothetical protein
MKRTVMLVLMVVALAATASAQGWGRGWAQSAMPATETVTVSGVLTVDHGMPAIRSGNITYLMGGLYRLSGFVDGIKEGAQVTIVGQASTGSPDNSVRTLRPTQLTLGGRTYDLSIPPGWGDPRQGFLNHPRMHRGW